MDSNLLRKLIIKGLKEAEETKERLNQKEKEFEENSRRVRQEIEKSRNWFPKD